MGLMFEHHRRDDIAGWLRILGDIEKATQISQVTQEIRLRLLLLEGVPAGQIPSVNLVSVHAANIPSTPTRRDRRQMIDQRYSVREIDGAFLVCGEGANQITRNSEAFRRSVTFEALVAAAETRLLSLSLIQSVKDWSQFRVNARDFQIRRAGTPRNIHIVVEEYRPRICG